ncbi:MAG TPA: sugar phosphate isomerase/epimerase family protein [Tepidisphaeraceae bacterium]|nr:sugar phosphate isomerase/epimerase family protein [Tepidisphaeraceae bacterium]
MEAFVQLAAEAGFAGADVNLGYAAERGAAALRDLFARHKLRFGGWGVPFDWRDPAKHESGLKILKTHAALAAELQIDSCCTWLLPASKLPFRQNWDWHIRQLRPIAQVLAEHGLRLGLEFVAPYHLRRSQPHEFIFTAGQMLELADEIGPNVGLLVDSYHCYCAGEPFSRIAQIPAQRIVLVHLNDAPAGPIHALEDFNRRLPGQGVMDLPGFIAALKQAGYRGPVSLEVFSPELKALSAQDAARRAWEATSKALSETGIV